jgi:hypothetical protein
MSKNKVAFVCLSCELHKQNAKFRTLTEAFEHMHEIEFPYKHDIVALIEESSPDEKSNDKARI